MVNVYVPYIEILWKRTPCSLQTIKEAGFDGVECHLIGRMRTPERVMEVREEVAQLDLCIRFHQGWSWETGQRILMNRILYPLGQLVPSGMPLVEQVSNAGSDPVVVYGNNVGKTHPPNYVFQTCSEYVNGKTYAMGFEEFISGVRRTGAPVVFDTQHVLEWYFQLHSITGLPTTEKVLLKALGDLWDELHPYVKEIHLNDFDPRRGSYRGRNMMPGGGVFPLVAFSTMVRATGWDGVITPEVQPVYLAGGGNLRHLRNRIDELFG